VEGTPKRKEPCRKHRAEASAVAVGTVKRNLALGCGNLADWVTEGRGWRPMDALSWLASNPVLAKGR